MCFSLTKVVCFSLTKAKPSTFHTCPHCNRVFNNKNNLKRHILIKHTTDKRFKCALCGRRLADLFATLLFNRWKPCIIVITSSFTKLLWIGDSKVTFVVFESSCYLPICLHHTVETSLLFYCWTSSREAVNTNSFWFDPPWIKPVSIV